MRFKRVRFTDESKQDLHGLQQDDPALLVEALRTAKLLDTGRLEGRRLRDFSKTGDLTDCRAVYFGVDEDDDTHRMVFREDASGIDVLEVVAVGERADDIAYLLAGLRLGRIEEPERRAGARRQVERSRRRRETRRQAPE